MNEQNSSSGYQSGGRVKNVLVHIGYHKTGTSWLQEFLFNEKWGIAEAVPRAVIKNSLIHLNALDYNQGKCRQAIAPYIQSAKEKKLIPVISEERLSGSPHSGGYDSKEIAERVYTAFPDAKILIIIREQENMIFSAYKQYVKGVGACSLKNYLAPSGQKKLPTFDFSHFKYNRLIQYYMELFGRENIMVLPYEGFKEDPAGFISAIIRFGGLRDFDVKALMENVNVSVNVSMSSVSAAYKRWMNPFLIEDMGSTCFLCPVIGRLIKRTVFILDRCIPAFVKKAHKKRYMKIVKAAVGGRYKESNRITSEIINSDLKKYGYDT